MACIVVTDREGKELGHVDRVEHGGSSSYHYECPMSGVKIQIHYSREGNVPTLTVSRFMGDFRVEVLLGQESVTRTLCGEDSYLTFSFSDPRSIIRVLWNGELNSFMFTVQMQ